MAYRSRSFALSLALTAPLFGILVLAGPAGATTTGTGTITCAYGDSMTFNPPLAGGSGTPGFKSEAVTLAPASISGCTGTSGTLPTLGIGTKSATFKIPGVKIGGVYYAGGCPTFVNYMWSKLKPHYDWTATGLTLKGTAVSHVSAESTSNPSTGDLGFQFSGTAHGSFSGSVTIDAYFTDASSAALQACIGNSGTVSSLAVDPTQSTIALG